MTPHFNYGFLLTGAHLKEGYVDPQRYVENTQQLCRKTVDFISDLLAEQVFS